MANKKTRAVSKEEFEMIISKIRSGFELPTGEKFRPNERIATALIIEGNLGLRIGDVVRLRLCDIVYEMNRYHLQIVEQKTGKERNFTVPTDIYIFLQDYALRNGIKPTQRLFDISVRAVQHHLQMTCKCLGLQGIGSYSFRKSMAQRVFDDNEKDITIVREILQHSSVAITQRYLGVSSQRVEQALQKNIFIPSSEQAT